MDDTFDGYIDFTQLIKIYGLMEDEVNKKRYSLAECGDTIKKVIAGWPDEARISTSCVERQKPNHAYVHERV